MDAAAHLAPLGNLSSLPLVLSVDISIIILICLWRFKPDHFCMCLALSRGGSGSGMDEVPLLSLYFDDLAQIPSFPLMEYIPFLYCLLVYTCSTRADFY